MSIRVGAKHKRGVSGSHDVRCEGFINVDVTSASRKKVDVLEARQLSPLLLGPVTMANGIRAEIFENAWQYGKCWSTHLNKDGTPNASWYSFRDKGYAKLAGARHPKRGSAKSSYYPQEGQGDVVMGYVESRKKIYVPLYAGLIRDLPIIKAMRGKNIMIIDGDGPPQDKYPEGMPMNQETWDLMINDDTTPFGHGYVVAALIAELDI